MGARSGKHPSLGLGSGRGLMGCRTEPAWGSLLSAEPTSRTPLPQLVLPLSHVNKIFRKKQPIFKRKRKETHRSPNTGRWRARAAQTPSLHPCYTGAECSRPTPGVLSPPCPPERSPPPQQCSPPHRGAPGPAAECSPLHAPSPSVPQPSAECSSPHPSGVLPTPPLWSALPCPPGAPL